MAKVDPNDPRPPYHQIADDLRRQVKSGELKQGQRLPSNRELAASYGVAPMTVHQAVRVLRDEGLVSSYQGRGVFVDGPGQGTGIPRYVRPSDEQTATRFDDLDVRLNSIEEQLTESVAQADAVADLRREVAELRAHLIELYGRTGHQYPRGDSTTATDAKTTTRRRASSA
jgi:DNA-binding GntR family transcriptional regulator